MPDGIEQLAQRLVIGHKRDGRCIYDGQTKRELVQACLRSGVSLAKVARKCGINANVLSNWVRLHERAKATPAAASGEVVEMPASTAFVPVQLGPTAPEQPVSTVNVQVRLPNGVVVDMNGCELQHAGRLIEALGRLRCSASTKG
jgi:transposase